MYNENELYDFIVNKNSLSVMHINDRNHSKHFDETVSLTVSLTRKLDIIAMSET